MKKLIVLTACLGATAMVMGQGQFNLANRVVAAGIDARVLTQAGEPISGEGWLAQAYMSDAEMGSYAPISGASFAFRTSPAAGLGYIAGGIATVAGMDAGTPIWIKLGAYNTNDGSTYEAAEAAFGLVGWSNAVRVELGGGTVQPPDLVGLQSWSVAIIPEPSTMALGLLGFAALMLRRRR